MGFLLTYGKVCALYWHVQEIYSYIFMVYKYLFTIEKKCKTMFFVPYVCPPSQRRVVPFPSFQKFSLVFSSGEILCVTICSFIHWEMGEKELHVLMSSRIVVFYAYTYT